MAGNRRAYDAAMKRAASLAMERKWSKAIEEYDKALAEFPQDVAVLTGVGLAYVETKQLEKALQVYKEAANLNTENPDVIQRVGFVYERLAQLTEAARAYVLAGEAAVRMRDVAQAIELWRKACVLAPQNLEAHRNLVRAYQGQSQNSRAAWHYLIMARILARQAKFDEATDCATDAIRLDPRNAEAEGVLEALQRGLPLPEGPTARLQPDAEGKRSLDSFVVFEDIEIAGTKLLEEGERVSPADLVLKHALAQMAEALFSDDLEPSKMQVFMLLGQAADYQARGLADQAMDAYQAAIEMGADSAAVRFSLGILYQEQQDFARAIEHLNHALSDPELSLGVNFAIGECYLRWGQASKALRYLLEALKFLDAQTVRPSQMDDLNVAYDQLVQEYTAPRAKPSNNGAPTAESFARSIVDFLSSKGWNERLMQARDQMDNLSQEGVMILGELLVEPEAHVAMAAMAHVHEYVQSNMLFTAIEECLSAIRESPYYLPLHLSLAELLVTEDRPQDAAFKYAMVAQTYQARDDTFRAIDAYRKALNIAPMDVSLRERLIALLVDARQFDQAIEQHMAMADAYYQLAQVDQSIGQYNQALKYASQGDPSRNWETNILHRIGDIYVQRVDWRQAIRMYQRIKHVDPDDEKARTLLVDLFIKLGQRTQALQEVDEMAEFYLGTKQPGKLAGAAKSIAAMHSDDLTLRMRLAKIYLDMRSKQEAIAELDAVGKLQLNQGKTEDAVRTIQAIIRLGPDRVEQYQRLLADLKRG
ncbi:MAG: tetratricopeptide repeat protein [Anaerolineae bacterium]|nr:tetratricopeptide repeat protein [Anaerolineae bacterium]